MGTPTLIEVPEGYLAVGREDGPDRAYVGFEANADLPHFAALPDEARSAVRLLDGLQRQALVFDRKAGASALRAALESANHPEFADPVGFLRKVGFSETRDEGAWDYVRHSTAVRRTTIRITDAGHLTATFEGRFPEDKVVLLEIGCAATGQAWPGFLESLSGRVIMALDLESAFGELGYDKGARARRAAAAAQEKAARRARRTKR